MLENVFFCVHLFDEFIKIPKFMHFCLSTFVLLTFHELVNSLYLLSRLLRNLRPHLAKVIKVVHKL